MFLKNKKNTLTKYNNFEATLPFLLLAVFVFFEYFLVSHHAMWRDELQAWLLVRDSRDIFELFRNLKYEGHPPLWYLLLIPLTRIFSFPESMQWLHLVIAASSVYVLARYSPFTWVQKVLITFGYFSFYEYAVISRNYGIGVLLIFIFCALFKDRDKKIFWIGVVLSLLANTNVLGLIITIVLSASLCLEFFQNRRGGQKKLNPPNTAFYVALSIIIISISASVAQILPAADGNFASGWVLKFDARNAESLVKIVVGAYLPIPEWNLHYWNTVLLSPNRLIGLLSSVAILLFLTFFIKSIRENPLLIFIFVGCTFSLLLFFYTKYHGALRHHGYLYIAFLMTVWISLSYKKSICACYFATTPPEVRGRNLTGGLINIIFLFQAFAGLSAATLGYENVFSNANAVALFLADEKYENDKLVGDTDYAASSVVGYLQNKPIFYPSSGRNGTFVRWDSYRRNISNQEAVDAAKILSKNSNENVILIMNSELGEQLLDKNHVRLLKSFLNATVGDENYYLYLVN